MKKKLLIIIIPFFLSCSNTALQREFHTLKKENEQLRNELSQANSIIEDLRNTPEIMLNNAKNSLLSNDSQAAESELNKLIQKHPASNESKEAKVLLANIKKERAQKLAEEERRKALGYKAFTDNPKFTIGDVTLNITGVTTGNTYTFDSYGDRYFYRTADKGSKYISISLTVTSDSKDPDFPPLYAFFLKNGELKYHGTFEYNFARWDDYGSYLGNYHDNGNDFAKRNTIRFKAGYEMTDEDLQLPVFIMAGKANCVSRNYERLRNPPIYYAGTWFNLDKRSVSIETVERKYVVIKVLNKNKI